MGGGGGGLIKGGFKWRVGASRDPQPTPPHLVHTFPPQPHPTSLLYHHHGGDQTNGSAAEVLMTMPYEMGGGGGGVGGMWGEGYGMDQGGVDKRKIKRGRGRPRKSQPRLSDQEHMQPLDPSLFDPNFWAMTMMTGHPGQGLDQGQGQGGGGLGGDGGLSSFMIPMQGMLTAVGQQHEGGVMGQEEEEGMLMQQALINMDPETLTAIINQAAAGSG